MTFGVLFGGGVPYAHPGDYGNTPAWVVVVFVVGILLLGFIYGFLKWKIRRSTPNPEVHSIESGATSKPCSYCGRENELVALICMECGTAFQTLESSQPEREQEAHVT